VDPLIRGARCARISRALVPQAPAPRIATCSHRILFRRSRPRRAHCCRSRFAGRGARQRTPRRIRCPGFRLYTSDERTRRRAGWRHEKCDRPGGRRLSGSRPRRQLPRRTDHPRPRGNDASRGRGRCAPETLSGLAGLGDLVLTCTGRAQPQPSRPASNLARAARSPKFSPVCAWWRGRGQPPPLFSTGRGKQASSCPSPSRWNAILSTAIAPPGNPRHLWSVPFGANDAQKTPYMQHFRATQVVRCIVALPRRRPIRMSRTAVSTKNSSH